MSNHVELGVHVNVAVEEKSEADSPSQGSVVVDDPSAPRLAPEGAAVAVACSGGGIRSASFTAGGLFYLCMATGYTPAALSSVSGGGYLATSFLHWARVHTQLGVAVRAWAPFFFGNFRRRVGYIMPDYAKAEQRAETEWTTNEDKKRDTGVVLQDALPTLAGRTGCCERVAATLRGLFYFVSRLVLLPTLALLVLAPSAFPVALLFDELLGDALRANDGEERFGYAVLYTAIAAGVSTLLTLLPWAQCSATHWIGLKKLHGLITGVSAACSFVFVLLLAVRGMHSLDQLRFTDSLLVSAGLTYSIIVAWAANMLPSRFNQLVSVWLAAGFYARISSWYVFRSSGSGPYPDQPIDVRQFNLRIHYFDIYIDTRTNVMSFDAAAADGTPLKLEWRGHGHALMLSMFVLSAFVWLFITLKDTLLHHWYRRSLRNAFYYKPDACGCDQNGECALNNNAQLKADIDQYSALKSGLHWPTTYFHCCFSLLHDWLVCVVSTLFRCAFGLCCFCGSCFSEKFVDFLRRALKRRRQAHWLHSRVEDMNEWVSVPDLEQQSDHAQQMRASVPVLSICTTVNQWQHGSASAPSFEHVVLQEGRVWRMGRHGDGSAADVQLAYHAIRFAPGDEEQARGVTTHQAKEAARNPPDFNGPVPDAANNVNNDNYARPAYTLKLSECMTISAAALSFGMGRFQGQLDSFKAGSLQGLLGLSLGRTVFTRRFQCGLGVIVPALLQLGSTGILVALGVHLWQESADDTRSPHSHGLAISFIVILAVQLLLICLWDPDAIAYFPVLRAARRLLRLAVLSKGGDGEPEAPGHLLLSDGGHSENLALLPPLRSRQRVIICMDGGADPSQSCQALLDVMDEAADRWNVHFSPWQPQNQAHVDLRPVTTHMHMHASQEDLPSMDAHAYVRASWRHETLHVDQDPTSALAVALQVHYPRITHPDRPVGDPNAEVIPAETGLLIYLKPRPWADDDHDTHSLQGCCCQCCHDCTSNCRCVGWCLSQSCGRFPHVTTPNQFFTPTMHKWYRQQGSMAMNRALDIKSAWESEQERL